MKKLLRAAAIILGATLIPMVIVGQETAEKVYYENGNTKSIAFKSGEEVMIVSFYENGTIMQKEFFEGEKKDGKFLRYYEDGSLQLIAEYEEGLPIGSWKSYNNQGELVGYATFVEGRLINGSIWDDQGKVIASR